MESRSAAVQGPACVMCAVVSPNSRMLEWMHAIRAWRIDTIACVPPALRLDTLEPVSGNANEHNVRNRRPRPGTPVAPATLARSPQLSPRCSRAHRPCPMRAGTKSRPTGRQRSRSPSARRHRRYPDAAPHEDAHAGRRLYAVRPVRHCEQDGLRAGYFTPTANRFAKVSQAPHATEKHTPNINTRPVHAGRVLRWRYAVRSESSPISARYMRR